ncbi:MAG: sensor histidine kinase [Methanothrix sp.]|nr:sensor histidine kinase [Methanothrix sp.]
MGQTLTALKIDLAWVSERYKNDEPFMERKNSMLKLVDSAMHAVRKISTDLRPGGLDHLGISAAMEWHAAEFSRRTNIPCEFISSPGDIVLDEASSITVFRIFQEALTNVARHARATKVSACLEMKDGKLTLNVKDDGRGITDAEIDDRQSFGLIGIRERVRALNGDLRISGVPNGGTLLEVSLPLGAK